MRKVFFWGAMALTIYGVIQMPRLGLEVTRSGSKYFGASRRIDFDKPETLADAQREVRQGPLRVMSKAAKVVYVGSSLASPNDAFSVGLAGGQFTVSELEGVQQRRRQAIEALEEAERRGGKVPKESGQAGTETAPPDDPQPNRRDDSDPRDAKLDWSTSLAGEWGGTVTISEKADASDAVVEPAGFEAVRQVGPYFDCKMWLKNDPDGFVEKFRLRHVGNGRYVGELSRKYTQPDMDFVETVSAVVDLKRQGGMIQGEILMKTSRRIGKKTTLYDSVMKLEFTR